jgi:mannosyltransferase OCH1-like enzyme
LFYLIVNFESIGTKPANSPTSGISNIKQQNTLTKQDAVSLILDQEKAKKSEINEVIKTEQITETSEQTERDIYSLSEFERARFMRQREESEDLTRIIHQTSLREW